MNVAEEKSQLNLLKFRFGLNHINNNLYAYAANNPVKYTDPDGRKLFVSGTKEYMAKVQRELTKLCPGARINFDTGEVTLSTSSKDTQGYKLLSTLIDSEKSNTIWIGDSRQIDLTSGPYGNSVRCYDTKIALSNGELIGDYTTVDGKIGGPMNTVINFDPDNVFGGKNDNGSNVRPPFVGLAHECGHSEAINNGTQTYEKPVYIPGTTPSREENSLKWENLIRKEHRLTPRSNYFYKPKEKPEGE
nr:M91 family zinc metallopeptidase [uncultured Treponema sp.]